MMKLSFSEINISQVLFSMIEILKYFWGKRIHAFLKIPWREKKLELTFIWNNMQSHDMQWLIYMISLETLFYSFPDPWIIMLSRGTQGILFVHSIFWKHIGTPL